MLCPVIFTDEHHLIHFLNINEKGNVIMKDTMVAWFQCHHIENPISLTTSVVSFSHLLTTPFLKTHEYFNYCGIFTDAFYVLEQMWKRLKLVFNHSSYFRHLNKKKKHWLQDEGTGSAKMLTYFPIFWTYSCHALLANSICSLTHTHTHNDNSC